MFYYPTLKNLEETKDWFRRLSFESYAENGFGLWAVVDKDTLEVLGDCGLTMQPTPYGLEPEIGYHLWKQHWGKGIASEAAAACRDYALQGLKMRRVVSIVSPENVPSQRVAERVHQRREVFTKENRLTGLPVQRYLYISDGY
jgi:RimJ/RimL family protein N-acetyltransferase